MEHTLSTASVEELDVMRPFFPILENPNILDTVFDMAFEADDDESTALFTVSITEDLDILGLDSGLYNNNITEEPATVAPLATLLSIDYSPDRTSTESVENDSVSVRQQSTPKSPPTPSTPIISMPTLAPAPATSSAADDGDIDLWDKHHDSQALNAPVLIQIARPRLTDEYTGNLATPAFATPVLNTMHSATEYSSEDPMYSRMHYPGHAHIQHPVGYGPPFMFYPPMGYWMHPIHPTYPMPHPAPPPPASIPATSKKRAFEFIEPEMPSNFIANPNNHGRWEFDSSGKRRYLNAPKLTKLCAS
ncbi:uncharacterized protein N7482_003876 [Penicillium canariense]|uniref:Uncharacterized protein n=1 Tax=Penicillium canariense TaxID=189055 RepID=A0A9W9LP24_9EURO|nr:uncharacterized protein N7482_003876 [Penicillium canariense]KAJ5168282.1 hypothetical protein N7482_003876 [Penicillium canariense]